VQRPLRAVVCGIMAGSWLAALAACGTIPAPTAGPVGGTPGEGAASPSPAATATPPPFKSELVLCLYAEPDRIVGSTTWVASVIRQAVLPSAISYGDDYAAEPVLLASLPSPDDGTLVRNDDGTLTVTLKYRDGLTWSDGTPFTAADALLGLQLPPSASDPYFEVVEARQTGDRVLEVTVAEGAEYPYVPPQPPLPSHALRGIDLSDPDRVDYMRQVNPSLGPYILDSWVFGSHILLNANPNYTPAPAIPMVRVRFIPDPSQMVTELTAGGCDVALDGDLGVDQIPALLAAQDAGTVRLLAVSGSVYEQMIFNTYPDPFVGLPLLADTRVRQAFVQAIDRAGLAQQMADGLSPALDSWLPPGHWAYAGAGNLPPYPYDPAAASALLDAAGWTDQDGDGVREYHGAGGVYGCNRGEWQIAEGTPLTPLLLTTDDPYRALITEAIRASLAQIGVRVQVQPLPAETLFAPDGPIVRRAFDLALLSAVTRPDPGGISRWVGSDVFVHPLERTLVHRWQLEERWLTSEQLVERAAPAQIPVLENGYQGQNFSGWCNEQADIAIVQASRALSMAERQAAYVQHQTWWAADLPTQPLFARPRIAASAMYVCGIVPGPHDVLTWNLGSWYFDKSGVCGG